MIRNELGHLVGLVFVDVVGRDLGGYVEEANRAVAERVALPPGYTLLWAGQFEYQLRAKETTSRPRYSERITRGKVEI